MASRTVDFLIVGGGVAAESCARALREEGAEGSILVVGREPDAAYERPVLSKGYLRGQQSRDDALLRPAAWWGENDVELLLRTSVMKLDPGERVAKLSNKEEVGFDKALIATGANVRRLRVDGADLEGIHYLRTFGNSDAIREDAAEAERVVMIGGSYIGTEVAASLTAEGKQCAIVTLEDVTLERQFGEQVGGFFQGVLEQHGIEIHGDDELERFEGADGRVQRVVTKRGRELDCDLVVVGAGVMPDAMLAKQAGLDLGERGGVLCSSGLETSAPGIYAAGDMCEYDSVIHGAALRIEHFVVAEEHGRTAALNMLGRDVVHEEVPYFFSDLADWVSMEYVGPGAGEPVVRGSLDDGEFTAFYVHDGRVSAALTVGRSDDLDAARRFIKGEASPDRSALADLDTDLSAL